VPKAAKAPPREVKVSREEELLRNAIQLFSRGGFRETSLQEIADELGITQPLWFLVGAAGAVALAMVLAR
jgi:AcrR family transcriptional regulator